MNNNKLRGLVAAVEKGTSIGLVALMGMLSYLVLPVTASAAELTTESTALSNPTISNASTTYTITQSGVTLSSIKCIKVLFSTAADGTGGIPTGMSITGATYNAVGSTYVPDVQTWVAAGVDGTGVVSITNSTGEIPGSTGPVAIVLTGITNGSTPDTSFFTTVSTYDNINCSTSPVDTNGQSAFVFTEGVVVSATVNPTLTFTVDSTTCGLGVLSITAHGKCSHTMTAASNATTGYAISYISSATLTSSGGPTITPNSAGSGTAVADAFGGEQFGLNLVANTIVPTVGANKSGDTTPTVAAQYNIPDSFAFKLAGDTIASINVPSGLTTFTVSYIANISPTTEAGLYTKTQTYNITATY